MLHSPFSMYFSVGWLPLQSLKAMYCSHLSLLLIYLFYSTTLWAFGEMTWISPYTQQQCSVGGVILSWKPIGMGFFVCLGINMITGELSHVNWKAWSWRVSKVSHVSSVTSLVRAHGKTTTFTIVMLLHHTYLTHSLVSKNTVGYAFSSVSKHRARTGG